MWVTPTRPTDPATLQRDFFDMLTESQWWPPDVLRNYQREQLGWLLRHARAQVPFYENRLDPVLASNGDIDWERWEDVPIVTRRDMVEHRDAMLARQLPPSHGPVALAETSGSTGLAIKITVNRLAAVVNNGLIWRSHVWSGLEWNNNLCVRTGTDSTAAFPDGKDGGQWGPVWAAAAREGRRWIINRYATGEQDLHFCARRQCSYLSTGPKVAHTLALDNNRLGLDVQLDAILCFGGTVGEEDRTVCKQAFGARLIEYYSSKEGAQIAHTCPAGKLHINGETVLVEIVDDRGEPCQPGELGRVIITPFFSTAQPLIRYDQGDLAIAGTTCSCGRSLPIIQEIAGRQLAMFHHPDGRVAARVLPMEGRHALCCEYMQVAQIGPNIYQVRYTPDGTGRSPDELQFKDIFRRTYFEDAEVELLRVERMPLTPVGKLVEYVNEWQPR